MAEAEERSSKDNDAELDAIQPEIQEIRNFYKQFPNEAGDALNKISNLARDLNVSIPTPEIVVIGRSDAGKALLIESLFGHPIFPSGTPIKMRSIFISVVSQMDCEVPRVTIKRDASVPEDVVLTSISELPNELKKRNAQSTSELPIQIKYESKYLGNFLLIDTPPLVIGEHINPSSPSPPSPSVSHSLSSNSPSEKIILEIVKPIHRTLMVVEEANDWESMEMVEWTKKIDIKFSRSVFAFSKFHIQLGKFSNAREFSQYFTRKPTDVKCFFWSGFSGSLREKCLKASDPKLEFQTRVWQSFERDMISLEDLKFEKKFEEMIGVTAIRNNILDMTWRSYKECLPELRKQLANSKKVSESNLRRIQDHLMNLDVSRLRSITSNYIADWLQIIVQLIEGSTEGNPSMTGQTLEEEHASFGDWMDYNNRAVIIEPDESTINNFDVKVYGGQQFERMMSVYKFILNEPEIFWISPKDAELASVVSNQRNSVFDYAWVASHIVQRRINDTFIPLIDQLCNRGEQIIQRLSDIAFQVLESRSSKKGHESQKTELQGMRGYSFFQSTIRDIFNEYVHKIGQTCKRKCLDEIQCTQLIYWELTSSDYSVTANETPQQMKDILLNMSIELFEDLRDTIVENVLLKCHNIFLVVMQRDLSGEILKNTSSFEDKLLVEMFEVHTARERLRGEEDRERVNQQSYFDKEASLRDISAQFNRLRLIPSSS